MITLGSLTLGSFGEVTTAEETIQVILTEGNLVFTGQTLTVNNDSIVTIDLEPGILEFIGGVLGTALPALLSQDAPFITIQGTYDIYYLTDELSTFAVDYWPIHESYIHVDLMPAPLTVVGVIAPPTYSILAGCIDYSYLYDFYFRIHIEPTVVDLGVVVSAQTYDVNIWNAFFVPELLSSVDTISLPDINLNFPYAIPYTFTPLQNITTSLSIAKFGDPIIDGFFNFNFVIGVYVLEVNGRRAILWPFAPLVDHTEKREWLTDVIGTPTNEERSKVREIPRITLNYKYTYRNREEFVAARMLSNNIAQYGLAIPYWDNVVKVTGLTLGDTFIYLDTTYLEYEVDSIVLVYVNYQVHELRVVKTVYSDRLELTQPLESSYTYAFIVPTYIGFSAKGFSFSEGENYDKEHTLSFTSTRAFNNFTYYTPTELYKTLPVLALPPVVTGGLSGSYSREQYIFDSITGLRGVDDTEYYNRLHYALRINTVTREDAYVLRRQIDYFQGRYKSFWLPSYHNDIIADGNITGGTQSLKVLVGNLMVAAPQFVRVVGNVTQCFEINTITDNLDGTAYLGFVETATVTISSITMIQVITRVRADSDINEYSRPDKYLTSIAVPVIEVPSTEVIL